MPISSIYWWSTIKQNIDVDLDLKKVFGMHKLSNLLSSKLTLINAGEMKLEHLNFYFNFY